MPLHRLQPSALRSRRRVATVAVAALASVSLAACTSESSTTKEAELTGTSADVQNAVSTFAAAAKRDDASGMCRDLITPQLRERLTTGGKTCAENLENAIEHADYTALAVKSVKLGEGPAPTTAAASIILVESDTITRQLVLAREPDSKKWLIASVYVPTSDATTPKTTTPAATTPKG